MWVHWSALSFLQAINKMGGEDLPDEGVDDEVCMSVQLWLLFYYFLTFWLHEIITDFCLN